MSRFLTAAMAALIVAAPLTVAAHSGGTNAQGCHTNRKTGDYHCHGKKGGSGSGRSQGQRAAPAAGGAYANCAAARAAGAAPVMRGEAGYGPHLDRDGDGIGCE